MRSSAISPRWALDVLVEVLDDMAAGRATETPQDESLVTYAAKITKAEGAVDWCLPAERIHNLVRGLQPWPLVSGRIAGTRVLLHRTELTPAVSPDRPGTIVRAEPDRFEIVAGDGHVLRMQDDSAGGAPRHVGARVPGWQARPARRQDRTRMIAPARDAAYRGAAARSRPIPPTFPTRSPGCARACQTTAIAP